jgi:S1-C subfamily serine protease
LRIRDDVAIALLPAGGARERWVEERVLATDPPSGLAVVRVAKVSPTPSISNWAPRRLERPQYLLVTDASPVRITFRPVFVAFLEPVATALWPDPIWTVPQRSDITPGSFVFTTAGELAGMVIEQGGRRGIVPSSVLMAEAERLLKNRFVPAGDLGVHVQSLTPDLSTATGASSGVVVTWVENAAPAADVLAVGDVIEYIDGEILPTLEHWRVNVARLEAGKALALRIRRDGELREVALQAPSPVSPPKRTGALGLRMRRAPRSGTELLAVEPGSAAARSGLAAGDVITFIGGVSSPTPVQIRSLFSSGAEGEPMMVAYTRGTAHHVTTLTR